MKILYCLYTFSLTMTIHLKKYFCVTNVYLKVCHISRYFVKSSNHFVNAKNYPKRLEVMRTLVVNGNFIM